MEKVKNLLNVEERPKYPLVVLKSMNYDTKNGGNEPFFIPLVMNNLFHNCMLYSMDSTNVMSLKVKNQLGLKTT